VSGGDLDPHEISGPQTLAFYSYDAIDVRRVGVASAEEVIRKFRIWTVYDGTLLTSDLILAPGKRDLLLGFHQPIPSFVLDFLGQMTVQARGRCSWLKRIREDAESLEPGLLDETVQLLEFRVRLSGKSHDKCRPQDKFRN